MSEVTNNPVDETKSNTSPVDNSNNDDVVAYATHLKLLDEKKKLAAKHSDVLAKLADYESKEKELTERKLLEEKKFQEVLETREKELNEYKSRYQSVLEEKTDFTKMHAFVSNLGDSKLDPKYYSLVPLDKISIEEDGNINLDNLNEVITSFKTEHPRLLIPLKNTLPSNKVGDSSGKKLSVDQWKSLGSAKEMMAKFNDVEF